MIQLVSDRRKTTKIFQGKTDTSTDCCWKKTPDSEINESFNDLVFSVDPRNPRNPWSLPFGCGSAALGLLASLRGQETFVRENLCAIQRN